MGNNDYVMAALEAAMSARISAMITGAPGTGKTATVRALAKKMGYELITLIGSQLDPTDVAGLPHAVKMFTDSDGVGIDGTAFLAPTWQVVIEQKKKVILFLDEFSNSSPAVQAAFLTILQNREFSNGTKFPDEAIIVGAMNPIDTAVDGYKLALPTTNRLMFISWDPTVEDWCNGMLGAWGNECSPEEMKWRKLIVRFIKDEPAWLHAEPNNAADPSIYGASTDAQQDVFYAAWASRRSWDNLCRMLPSVEKNRMAREIIMNGTVGYPATVAFIEWEAKNNSTMNPEEVLNNPSVVDWGKVQIDDANLLFRGVLELDFSKATKKQKLLELFDTVAESGRLDLAVSHITAAISFFPKDAKSKPAVFAVLGKYKPVTQHM